jgi:hypothetical protein
MSAVATIVRKARVAHRCANASRAERGLDWAQQCHRDINPGDQYAEGEINPYEAGGFAHERFCMSCAELGLM